MSQSLTTISNLHCCALIPKPVHSAAESSQTTGKYTMIFYINLLYDEYHGIQIFIFHGELWQQTNNFSEIIHEIHNVYNLCNKCLYLKYDSQFKADCNWFLIVSTLMLLLRTFLFFHCEQLVLMKSV